jgi:hypothetical protein
LRRPALFITAAHESLGYTNSIFGTQSVQEYQENSHKHSGLTYAKDWAGDCWKPSTLPPGQPSSGLNPYSQIR